jgi:hypothetical protein
MLMREKAYLGSEKKEGRKTSEGKFPQRKSGKNFNRAGMASILFVLLLIMYLVFNIYDL